MTKQQNTLAVALIGDGSSGNRQQWIKRSTRATTSIG